MGIRISKTMGWGLAVPHEEFVELLNPELDELSESLTSSDYDAFLTQKYGDIETLLNEKRLPENLDAFFQNFSEKNWDGYDLFRTYDSFTSEKEDVLVVIPAGQVKSWSRYDDDFDYNEAAYAIQDTNDDIINNQAKWLKYNPYPFDGSYMHAETGFTLSNKDRLVVRELLRIEETLKQTDQKIEDIFYEDKLNIKLQEIGFNSWVDMKKQLVQNVPHEVRDVCEWLNIFTHPETVLRLKPVMIVHWG